MGSIVVKSGTKVSSQTDDAAAKPGDGPADAVELADDQREVSSNKLRLFLLLVVPLLAIIVALIFYMRGGRYVSTENAYVKSNVLAISSDVSGRAIEVLVKDNEFVRRGDLMFRLDAEPLELDVMQAQAQMDVARADIEALRAEHREALVSVSEASSRVEYLRREFQRQKSLKAQGLGGGQAHDEARFELRAAQQRVTVLNERTRKSLATFNGNPDLPVEKHPTYLRASVAHEMALSRLAKTTVVAPADGVVSNVQLQAGEYVEAGEAIFSLIETNHVWVEANLKETQLTHIKEGQQATLEVDAYPDVEWQATVASIAPATGAQFTLLPPQNATGNWVKVVQRVPVNLQVHAAEDAPILRAGMTVSVTIDTEHQRQAPSFLRDLAAVDAKPARVVTQSQELLQTRSNAAAVVDTELAKATADSAQATAPGQVTLIEEQSPDQFTVELARTDEIESLKGLFDKLPVEQAVMLYQLQNGADGKNIYGLSTGLFVSKVQAYQTLASLPLEARRFGPLVRQVGAVQKELITN